MKTISQIVWSFLAIVCLNACLPGNNHPVNPKGADSLKSHPQPALADSLVEAPISAGQLITPGKSIGHIVLGEDQATAIARLGKPDFGDAAMGSSLVTWYSNHDSTKFQTSIFASKNFGATDENIARIKKILVTSPWFRTAENLGVGSSVEELGRVYQLSTTHTATQQTDNMTTFTDTVKGISFELGKGKKCVGVIVHDPGEEGGTYLDMHQH